MEEQQGQPWKPVVLVLVFWALSAANVYFCWCYPGSSLLASVACLQEALSCHALGLQEQSQQAITTGLA
jgi:hypothetical protein